MSVGHIICHQDYKSLREQKLGDLCTIANSIISFQVSKSQNIFVSELELFISIFINKRDVTWSIIY